MNAIIRVQSAIAIDHGRGEYEPDIETEVHFVVLTVGGVTLTGSRYVGEKGRRLAQKEEQYVIAGLVGK